MNSPRPDIPRLLEVASDGMGWTITIFQELPGCPAESRIPNPRGLPFGADSPCRGRSGGGIGRGARDPNVFYFTTTTAPRRTTRHSSEWQSQRTERRIEGEPEHCSRVATLSPFLRRVKVTAVLPPHATSASSSEKERGNWIVAFLI